jgi:predicted lipoprotein with Yx(FWY)xxD motif
MSGVSTTSTMQRLIGGGRGPAAFRAVIATAAAAALLSACGGGSSGGAATDGSAPAGETASPTAAAPTSGTANGSAAVSTATGPLGPYLTDGKGRAVYMFASDTATSSTCDGSCATVWPPLPAPSTTTASGDASATQLGAITRSDGSRQLTYAGHPLYYYQADTAAGDTKGEGSNGFGAKWWILSPDGSPITDSATTAGGGYDY